MVIHGLPHVFSKLGVGVTVVDSKVNMICNRSEPAAKLAMSREFCNLGELFLQTYSNKTTLLFLQEFKF